MPLLCIGSTINNGLSLSSDITIISIDLRLRIIPFVCSMELTF